MTEYEKQQRGIVYDALDPTLLEALYACQELCWEYNRIRPSDQEARSEKISAILGTSDRDTFINQPFHCDYVKNIIVGKRFFANFNFTVLDVAWVTIGYDCHSTDPMERNTRREWARPVTIGNSCWIGGSVTILPGVSIGDNVTIGAGSVVVRDIPSDSIAVGNPAKVVKTIPPSSPSIHNR